MYTTKSIISLLVCVLTNWKPLFSVIAHSCGGILAPVGVVMRIAMDLAMEMQMRVVGVLLETGLANEYEEQ